MNTNKKTCPYDGGLRPVSIGEMIQNSTPKILRSSIALPSQHQAYAVCVEFAKNWFLEKFDEDYFNSVYVNTAHSFDEFRKFSSINDQLKRTNPLLAITPVIDMSHNRQWVDSMPEAPKIMTRSHMDAAFMHDYEKNIHLQLACKTILMTFTYKIRVNTRAEELDMMEFIKLNHRAGWTQSKYLAVDVHVPKQIITQIAYDNGFNIKNNGSIEEPIKLLEYLNRHSGIPFLYKLRCSTGNEEFFLKVPNCCAHIKAEMPTMDDGERQDAITTNYNIDFQIEVEMAAPYCFIYYSQFEHKFILPYDRYSKQDIVAIMPAIKTEVPKIDENGWDLCTTTEYDVDDEDIRKPISIDFSEFFKGHEIYNIIEYTKAIAISPAIFINFIILNDGIPIRYEMDWNTMICNTDIISNTRSIIGIYCDKKYMNDALIYLNDLDKRPRIIQ